MIICQELEVVGMRSDCLMATGLPFWGDENILELHSGDGCTTLWLYQRSLMGCCILRVFYHKKGSLKKNPNQKEKPLGCRDKEIVEVDTLFTT